jgi:hypothetical protein
MVPATSRSYDPSWRPIPQYPLATALLRCAESLLGADVHDGLIADPVIRAALTRTLTALLP